MKTILLSLVFTLNTVNGEKQQHISGEYSSLWGDTLWAYKFKPNGNYVHSTSGHFGYSKTVGTYRMSNDTLYLAALPSHKQADPKSYFEADTLFRLSDTCFVDLSLGYEYRKIRGNNIKASRKRDVHIKGMPVIE